MKTIIAVFCLVNTLKFACLSQDAIKGLGFSTALDSPDVRSDTSFCKGLYDNGGACVSSSDIENVLTSAKWGIKTYTDIQWVVMDFFSNTTVDNQLV